MDEEQGFLSEILANPDEDLPRLIYADWLEERGDPRGELIRVQCELARIDAGSDRAVLLQKRERKLLSDNYERWVEEPLVLSGVGEARFRRGMIEELDLAAEVFLSLGESLFRKAPLLRHVSLSKASRELERLPNFPLLARLTGLSLPGDNEYLGNEGLAIVIASPYLTDLKSFGIPDNQIGPAGIRALVTSKAFPRLANLDLPGNPFGMRGIYHLTTWPHLAHLSTLNLSRTRVQFRDLASLVQSRTWNHRTTLRLGPADLTHDASTELRERYHVKLVLD